MKIDAPITQCTICGGNLYDNRGSKKSARSPDYRCKDNRDHVFWLSAPSGGTTQSAAPASYTWAELGMTFAKCHEIAVKIVGASPAEVVQSATATLFITAIQRGLKVSPAAPKPPPPPVEDYPEPDYGDEAPY